MLIGFRPERGPEMTLKKNMIISSLSFHITQPTNYTITELLAPPFTLTLCEVKSYLTDTLQKGFVIEFQTKGKKSSALLSC
jgi:hypothetical protein